ncbi:MAG: four helix bundle protein [Paraglaciecola sp.]|jgi:four helix bundle protein
MIKTENYLLLKFYNFSIRIVKAFRYLNKEKREFILSKQLIRSGTFIGANSEEA